MRKYGIEQSIFEKSNHYMIYKALNFILPLPPTYYRKIWNNKNENTERIQKLISNFDLSEPFKNNHANKNFKVLTDSFMNMRAWLKRKLTIF